MEVVETTRVSSRGQVIIPQRIRAATGLRQDDLLAVAAVDEDAILLKRIDGEQLLKDFQRLRRSVKKRFSDADIDAEIKGLRRARH